MQLAHAAQNRLARFAIGFEIQRRIGANHLAERCAELLLIGLVLGLHGHADDGVREAHTLEHDRRVGIAQRVARVGFGERNQRDDVAGAGLFDRVRLLSEHFDHAADLLALAASRVHHRHALRQHARVHAHECQRTVRIVDDLERKAGKRLVVRADTLANGIAVRVDGLDRGDVGGGGEIVYDCVEHLRRTLVLVRGAAEHRIEGAADRALAQAGAQHVGRRNRAIGQIDFHRRIVLLEAGVDELAAVLIDAGQNLAIARNGDSKLVREIRRDLVRDRLRIAIVLFPYESLHLDQIDHTAEVVFRADRQMYGQGTSAEALLDHVHAAQEARAAAVHFVYVADTRNLIVVCETPVRLRLGLHTRHAVEHHHRAVEHAQGTVHFDREVDVSRGVDDVDLFLTPERGHSGGLNRDAALLFLLHVVRRRRGLQILRFVNVDHRVLAPRVVQDAFRRRRLAGVDVGDDADVADVR